MKPGLPSPDSAAEHLPELISNPIFDPAILGHLTSAQWAAIEQYIWARRTKRQPKLVDVRFVVDLVITRFYIVLLVGKDRRHQDRLYPLSPLTKLGNIVMAVLLLILANLAISAAIVLMLYLTKSALGFDFLPGHITQSLEQWFN